MKYLALDIGNVCIEIDQLSAWKQMGFTAPAPALAEIAARFETGFITEAEFSRAVLELSPCKNRTVKELREIFLSILVKPKTDMAELISSLPARGVQPVFFSDISFLHLQKTREMFPAAKHVPCGIFSFEVGAMKPQKAMFRAFEARFGKPFLYTDDRADLIAAAEKYGWQAHRFVSADDLEKTLFSR